MISGGGKALKKGFLSAEKRELPRFYLAVAGLLTGMVIMVTGYTLGRAFVYATKEYAIIKLPFEILQAGVGAVIAPILAYKTPLKKVFFAVNKKKEETPPEENTEKNLKKRYKRKEAFPPREGFFFVNRRNFQRSSDELMLFLYSPGVMPVQFLKM